MNNSLYSKLIFELSHSGSKAYSLPANNFGDYTLPGEMARADDAPLPECDELMVVRHYTNHSQNNFGVDSGFYPLGSCTMKYNPKIDEEIASMPQFTAVHPLQCDRSNLVYNTVKTELRKMLSSITGMADFSLQPFAGAHGELSGLTVIRLYHEQRHDNKRTKVIIPDSAHGTNPASAAVCGLEVIEVKSTADGLVDIEHLADIIAEHGEHIAGMMMTNPNTLGLFERHIIEITEMVHHCGGLMYYDGANLNALLGVCRPGDMGFDVLHVNLHKTFATPHGGGGPGAGPIGVRKGLEPFLSTFDVYRGNFGVLLKAFTYILTLGREHITKVGPLAILNANYIKECLKDRYSLPIDTLCKHEFVFDGLKDKSTGVTTMDVAKRLLDYGYHAPTIYFPLLFHESMMIEPTENESKQTLDNFIAVLQKIADEALHTPDVVKQAPHCTPIGRVDDVEAATHPVLTFRKLMS